MIGSLIVWKFRSLEDCKLLSWLFKSLKDCKFESLEVWKIVSS